MRSARITGCLFEAIPEPTGIDQEKKKKIRSVLAGVTTNVKPAAVA
jgi:hypothetical protein